MRIKLLVSISCGVNGSHSAGSVVEWTDDADAGRLVAAGYAEAIDAEKGGRGDAETDAVKVPKLETAARESAPRKAVKK